MTEIMEIRRTEFEKTIVLPLTVMWCHEQNKYTGDNFWLADYAWQTWNAALDSVVVELPEPFAGDDFTMYDGKEIIEAIQQTGSISAAAHSLGMSYRRAWLLVETMNRTI